MTTIRAVISTAGAIGALACGGPGPSATPSDGPPANPHPLGWATNVAGGVTGFHGAAAKAQEGCVACHAPGGSLLLCDVCHRSGGSAGSLHPAGFGLTHSRSEIPGNAPVDIGGGISLTCLACHPGG